MGIEKACNVIRESSGTRRISIDEHLHRDGVKPDDEVRVVMTKDGYAAYSLKLADLFG